MHNPYCCLKCFNLGSVLLGGALLMGFDAAAQPVLRVHGAVVLKGLLEPNLEAVSTQCGSRIELVGNGADNGLLDLVQGRADVAMLSAPLDAIAQKLNAKSPGAVNTASLQVLPLGFARIVLVVNPRNPVRRLSYEQARGLLTGAISNWKDVGGLDQEVVVAAPVAGNGTRTTVESQFLKGAAISTSAQTVPNPGLVRMTVSQSPRAIGFIGSGLVSDKVAVVACETQISSEVSLAVRGAPSDPVRRLAEAVRPLVK